MSLRLRLAVVLAVTVLAPLLAVGAAVGVLVPRVAEQAAADRLGVSARSASAALAAQCTALGLAARSLALEAAPALVAGQPPPQSSTESAASAVPRSSAAVLGPGGELLAAAGDADLTGTGGLSCSGGAAVAGVPAAGTLQVESVPVRDTGPEPVGWAVVAVPLDDAALQELRERSGLPSGLVLVDGGQVLAAHVPGVEGDSDALAGVAAAAASPAADPGAVGGVRYHVGAAAPGVPGRVVAVEPLGSSTLGWAVPALLAAAALLATTGTVVVARRLTAPLEELTRTVARLGAGDLSTRTVVHGRDEVGRLAAAVNAMADALEASTAEADAGRAALADSLERLGEALARTHDLDGLLQTVAEAAASESGADTCIVYVADGLEVTERAVVDVEVNSQATGSRLRELARQAVAERREVSDAAVPGMSVVSLPLAHGDRVLGAVVLAGRRPIEGERLAAARSLVGPAGTAIVNVLLHEEASRLSVTDPLTGLANFRSLSDTLSRETERAARFNRPLSVLMLDLDNFKTVNDTWGHAAGDAVLRMLGSRLTSLVREVDTVARYGGEEFAVVLPETGTVGAMEVAQRIVEAVRREPFGTVGESQPLRVTASVGVATYPRHARTAADLMRRADEALYRAKAAGRDRWAAATGPGAGEEAGG